MEYVVEKLKEDSLAIAVADKKGQILFSSKDHGIKSLMQLYKDNPEILNNGVVADKIIGKAAASIFILGNVSYCFAEVISEIAAALFDRYNIQYSFEKKVKYIENNDRTDMCPMEKLVMNCETPLECFENLNKRLF